MITGIVLSGVLGTIVPAMNFPDWVGKYQTLIAGCLALFGAMLTVTLIRRQISLAEAHHNDLIERNLVAARSVLPMTLSELVRYGENCLSISFDIARRRAISNEFRRPSEGVFEAFRKVIKYAPEEKQSEMAGLLSNLQVQISRLTRELESYTPLNRAERLYPGNIRLGDQNNSKHHYILDAAKLIFQSEDLLEYARGKEDEATNKTDAERFRGLFLRLRLDSGQWPNLIAAAERRFG